MPCTSNTDPYSRSWVLSAILLTQLALLACDQSDKDAKGSSAAPAMTVASEGGAGGAGAAPADGDSTTADTVSVGGMGSVPMADPSSSESSASDEGGSAASTSGGTGAAGPVGEAEPSVTTGGEQAASVSGDAGAPGNSTDAGSASMSKANAYPPASETLQAMNRANRWFMDRHPDPGAPAPGNRTSNLWTRGVYYEGLMALYELTQDANYLDYAVQWGEANNWSLRFGAQSSQADPHAAGQTYLDLYKLEGQTNDAWIADIQTSVDLMVASPAVDAWTWIDAIQMSLPVFARFFDLTGDQAYLDKGWDLYSYTRNTEGGGLFNPQQGLWWRDADFAPGGTYTLSPNGRDIYWSRGNGWVLAALVRMLQPASDAAAHRDEYEADLRAMAEALVPLQRADGFWNTSLIDPTHCATKGLPDEDGPETSGTALFTYGMGWGIRNGVLDEETFGPVVRGAWQGLVTEALHEDGMLGYIQSTGAQPCDPDGERGLGYDVIPDFDDFGVGCFLLAGSAIARLGE